MKNANTHIYNQTSKEEKISIAISMLVHTLIILTLIVAPSLFSSLRNDSLKQDTIIVFDLKDLKISSKDNLSKKKVEEKKEEKQQPKPEKLETKPELPKPVVKPKEIEKPQPTLEPEKPKAKPKPVIKPKGSVEDLLKSVEKPIKKEELPKEKAVQESTTEETFVDEKKLSISYITALKYRMRGCWNIDAGIKDIHTIQVVINTTFLPDGSIQSAEIEDNFKMTTDGNFAAVAQSAKRALFTCAPYNLPIDKYDEWKNIRFTFSP